MRNDTRLALPLERLGSVTQAQLAEDFERHYQGRLPLAEA